MILSWVVIAHQSCRLQGSDDELSERLRTYDDYIISQRQKRKGQEAHLEDVEEQLQAARSSHVAFMGRQGTMIAEDKVRHFATSLSVQNWS